MTTYWLSPIYNGIQFTNSDGAPLSGGSIYTYVGGSYTTEATTFADNTGTPNTNPIILDSSGRLPNVGIWLDSTQSYNFVLSNGSIILDRVANVTGVPIPISSSSSNIIWNTITPAPTYVSTTSFLVPGSFTTQFAVGNRVQILNSTSAYQYATVTAVSYSSGNTNVTVQNDSTALSSLMVQVAWSDLVANGVDVCQVQRIYPYAAGHAIKKQPKLLFCGAN